MSDYETHNEDPSANSPGTILRRCREYHLISLEEAAEATKIGANYLQALENDQVNEFANLAYLKGFLRIYATHLGLNPDDMIRLYERQFTPTGTLKSETPGSGESTLSGGIRNFSWQKLALPAILLLLLIVTSFVLNRSSESPQQSVPPQQVPAAVPAQAVQKVQSSIHQAPSIAQKPDSESETTKQSISAETAPDHRGAQSPAPESAKGFVVRLKVTQSGTLAVTIDGSSTQTYDLTSGDVFEWKAEKTIGLDLSSAGSVSAELSGKPLKPFGPVGTPAFIVLDANGVKQ